jgi:hypothetical protein
MKKIALLLSVIATVSVFAGCACKTEVAPTPAPAHQDYKGEVTSKK